MLLTGEIDEGESGVAPALFISYQIGWCFFDPSHSLVLFASIAFALLPGPGPISWIVFWAIRWGEMGWVRSVLLSHPFPFFFFFFYIFLIQIPSFHPALVVMV